MAATTLSTLKPMRYESVDFDDDVAFVADPAWVAEPKVDGIRCLVKVRAGGEVVTLHGHGGRLLTERAGFADLRARFAGLVGDWAFDGEWVDGVLWLFDLPLGVGGRITPASPLTERRTALELVHERLWTFCRWVRLVPQAQGAEHKAELVAEVRAVGSEGVCWKHLDGTYRADGGRTRDVVKMKLTRTATCVVTATHLDGKDNCALAVHRDGRFVEVAHASLRFDVVPGQVVEVRYLGLGAGERLVQPRLERERPDKAPVDCDWAQLGAMSALIPSCSV